MSETSKCVSYEENLFCHNKLALYLSFIIPGINLLIYFLTYCFAKGRPGFAVYLARLTCNVLTSISFTGFFCITSFEDQEYWALLSISTLFAWFIFLVYIYIQNSFLEAICINNMDCYNGVIFSILDYGLLESLLEYLNIPDDDEMFANKSMIILVPKGETFEKGILYRPTNFFKFIKLNSFGKALWWILTKLGVNVIFEDIWWLSAEIIFGDNFNINDESKTKDLEKQDNSIKDKDAYLKEEDKVSNKENKTKSSLEQSLIDKSYDEKPQNVYDVMPQQNIYPMIPNTEYNNESNYNGNPYSNLT